MASRTQGTSWYVGHRKSWSILRTHHVAVLTPSHPSLPKYPVACYDTDPDSQSEWTLINKFCGSFWAATLPSTPFNVVVSHPAEEECAYTCVAISAGEHFTHCARSSTFTLSPPCQAWHGNYAPFKYDLERFCAVGSVSYDHLDPSVYTVLTVPSEVSGEAIAGAPAPPEVSNFAWTVCSSSLRQRALSLTCVQTLSFFLRGGW